MTGAVRRIVEQLKETGAVARGFLGVQIQPVTADIASALGLEKAEGAIVSRVEPNGPAAQAGLKAGDVILSVNGKPVRSARDLSRRVAELGPDADATLELWRDSGKRDLRVKLGRQVNERTAAAAERDAGARMSALGLRLAPAASVGGADKKGVAVVGVEPGSPAAEKGVRTGDVIAEVGGRPVEAPADVRRALDEARTDGKTSVLVRLEARDGSRFVALQVPSA